MASPSTNALDLLRFLALSLEVHCDALCCAVDDVEAAIVESSINDELMDGLEEELAGLLDRQRRLHAGQAVIALSQKERMRGSEIRRERRPPTQPWGDKRIQTSRTPSRATSVAAGQQGALRSSQQTKNVADREPSLDDVSTRCLSTAEESLAADVASVDRQVEVLRAKIEELDCYSLRGKLLQLEKMKRAVKDVDLEAVVESVVDGFEFPAAVETLWAADKEPSLSFTSSSAPAVPRGHGASPSRRTALTDDLTLAQHAAGKGHAVNHTNIDLLLARACQRLAGRSVDALEALASTTVSEESAAPHVLGCMVYATEFERSERGELRSVMELQTMPSDALARHYHRWKNAAICTASIDARCLGARETVLAAQDFSALPSDWATAQSLSRVPLEEVLPPIRHLLSPRFTFANAGELRRLQATRVALQRKVVRFLLEGSDSDEELLRQLPGSTQDHAAASARLAVAECTPPTVSGHAWKTLMRVARDTQP